MASKGINTNTLLMVGGLAVVGVGAFYFLSKRQEALPAPSQTATAATNAAASAAGVTDPAVYAQMLSAMQSMMSKMNSGISKDQAQAELISTYVNMGVTGATQILGAIGSFF